MIIEGEKLLPFDIKESIHKNTISELGKYIDNYDDLESYLAMTYLNKKLRMSAKSTKGKVSKRYD